jgi:hypothetical protein
VSGVFLEVSTLYFYFYGFWTKAAVSVTVLLKQKGVTQPLQK